MKKFAVLAIGPLIFTVVLASALEVRPVRILDFKDTHIRALGVCEIETEEADCWNMDGKPDKELSEFVNQGLDWSQLQQANKMDFNPDNRERNVFAVATCKGEQGASLHAPAGFYPSPNIGINEFEEGWLNLVAVPKRYFGKSMVVTASITNIDDIPPLSLDLRLGATASQGINSFTVGAIAKIKTDEFKQNYIVSADDIALSEISRWRIDLGYTGNGYVGQVGYTPIGVNGKPIDYVDRAGRPQNVVAYLEEQPFTFDINWPGRLANPKTFRAGISRVYSRSPNSMTLVSNIDPGFVKSISIKTTSTYERAIGPFPLAPK